MKIDLPLHLKYASQLGAPIEFLTTHGMPFKDELDLYEWKKGERGRLTGVLHTPIGYQLVCESASGEYCDIAIEEAAQHIRVLN